VQLAFAADGVLIMLVQLMVLMLLVVQLVLGSVVMLVYR
jgi:hypothetical protein